jgi:hypothetical protein
MDIFHGDLCALFLFLGLFETLLFAAIGAFLRLASGLFFQSTFAAGKGCHVLRPPHRSFLVTAFHAPYGHPDRLMQKRQDRELSVIPAKAGIRAPASRRDLRGASPLPGDARSR